MRATKQALAADLRADPALAELVPSSSIYAVERITLPALPAIEIIGIRSAPADYLIRHEISIETTVSNATEDAADAQLDAIVSALRTRLLRAQSTDQPIAGLSVELGGVSWSVSAKGTSGTVRGAAVALTVTVND